MAANQRSVPTAVTGAMPKTRRRIGVIKAPPPTPVRPTINPVRKPATINMASIKPQILTLCKVIIDTYKDRL
jgi:hypothetical protein